MVGAGVGYYVWSSGRVTVSRYKRDLQMNPKP